MCFGEMLRLCAKESQAFLAGITWDKTESNDNQRMVYNENVLL